MQLTLKAGRGTGDESINYMYLTEEEPFCATIRFLHVVPNGTPIQSPSATVLPTSSGLLAQELPVS